MKMGIGMLWMAWSSCSWSWCVVCGAWGVGAAKMVWVVE